MAIEKYLAKLFFKNDDDWLKHANPLSVWSRFATLPFVVLAIWSREWIGWYCLVPIFFLIAWVVKNPTIFGKPNNYESWASKAVLGERLFIDRDNNSIDIKHTRMLSRASSKSPTH